MQTILKVYVRLFFLLFPLLLWPISLDPYGLGKGWWLVVGALVGIVLWGVGMVVEKREVVITNKTLWIWLLLGIWAVISWWRGTVGVKARGVGVYFGMDTIVGLLGWMWLFLQVGGKEERKIQLKYLTVSGVILTVLALVMFLVPEKTWPLLLPNKNLPLLVVGQGWNIAGGLWAQVMVLLVLLGWWGYQVIDRYKRGPTTGSGLGSGSLVGAGVLTAVIFLGLFLSGYALVKIGYNWLDLNTSWVIAVEAFKRSPLWGVGIGNFVQGFYSFRPLAYNLTPAWGSVYNYSGLAVLHWWTELGIVGLGLLAWLVLTWVKSGVDKRVKWAGMGLIFLILVVPWQLVGGLLLVWLLAGIESNREKKLILNVGEKDLNVMPAVVALLLIVGSGLIVWRGVKTVRAEFYQWRSYLTAQKNDGVGTYNWRLKAVQTNPNLAELRVNYSQTNLALVKVLLSNKDLSDEDKQKASVLLQQAVSEAKAAVALDSLNPAYWINLSVIYRDMIGVVDGSADWAFQAYQQAVALDPYNVPLRLEMGGLLFASGRYDEADRVFEQVVTGKQDLANGWYNWAYSAKRLNKLGDAVARLEQAVALVPVTSADYDKASGELRDWRKELETEKAKASVGANVTPTPTKGPEQLSVPQPLPTVKKEDQVVVPTGVLEPPAVTVVPSVTPTEIPARGP